MYVTCACLVSELWEGRVCLPGLSVCGRSCGYPAPCPRCRCLGVFVRVSRSQLRAPRPPRWSERLVRVQAQAAEAAAAAAQARAALRAELGRVFGRGGVQHFEVDGAVHDLSARTAPLLRLLAPQFQLHLHTQRVRPDLNPLPAWTCTRE